VKRVVITDVGLGSLEDIGLVTLVLDFGLAENNISIRVGRLVHLGCRDDKKDLVLTLSTVPVSSPSLTVDRITGRDGKPYIFRSAECDTVNSRNADEAELGQALAGLFLCAVERQGRRRRAFTALVVGRSVRVCRLFVVLEAELRDLFDFGGHLRTRRRQVSPIEDGLYIRAQTRKAAAISPKLKEASARGHDSLPEGPATSRMGHNFSSRVSAEFCLCCTQSESSCPLTLLALGVETDLG
jgi:hypothetical protein